MTTTVLIFGLTGILSDSTEELLIVVSAVFSGIASLGALINWYRVGKLQDRIMSRSDTRLGVRLDELEEGLVREQHDIKKRLAELEEWRSQERRELLDTSARLIHAMDTLRSQIHDDRDAIVSELKLEIRTVQDQWMRKIAKEEAHRAISERMGKHEAEG